MSLLLASLALASSTVHLVDTSGAGDFQDLQTAVDAAADGDTLVVRRPPEDAAAYAGFVIDGKGLSIVSVRNEGLATGEVVVRGLAPGQAVVISGLTIGGLDAVPGTAGLTIEDCMGSVRIQDTAVRASFDSTTKTDGAPGCVVRACRDVVFTDSVVNGGFPAFAPSSGGAGLLVEDSSVGLYGSSCYGGRGGEDVPFLEHADGGRGGAGVVLTAASRFTARDSEIAGGMGGTISLDPGAQPGTGGDGLEVSPDSTAELVGTDVVGGPGGYTQVSVGAPGTDVVGPATVTEARARRFHVADRAEEREAITLEVEGLAGDRVILLQSASTASQPAVRALGTLQLAQPITTQVLGILPASGALSVALPAPDAPHASAQELVLQVVFVPAHGAPRLSRPRHVFVFDEAAPPICGARLFVDRDAAPGGDGSTWARAHRDLADALPFVTDCPDHPTEIWIAEGTYRPGPAGGPRTSTFRLYSGARLYGGFAGHEERLDERDPLANPVVLSGDLDADDVLTVATGPSGMPGFGAREDNALHVLRAGTNQLSVHRVRVEGVTVRGGNADLNGDGGGGAVVFGSASFVRCTFTDNRADAGGAIYFRGDRDVVDTLEIVSSRIVANSAESNGAGLFLTAVTSFGVPPLFHRVLVANSVLAGNATENFSFGGALRATSNCELEFVNNVVYRNFTFLGGVLFTSTSAPARIVNSVFFENESLDFGFLQGAQLDVPQGTVDRCLVQGLDGSLGGAGNLLGDPGFVDALGPDGVSGTLDDDLRPGPGSPLVDAGDNLALVPDAFDLDGDGDVLELLPLDLGEQPRRQDDPLVPDTGAGSAPIVDLGPFEREE